MVEQKYPIAQITEADEKAAIYGGFELRETYERIVSGKGRKNSRRFLFRCGLCLLGAIVFVMITFVCLSLYQNFIRSRMALSEPDKEELRIGDDKIQSTFISAQTGMKFEEVGREESTLYAIPVGVRVKSISDESSEYRSGFREGDIIVKFNGYQIRNLEDLFEQLGNCCSDDSVVYTIFRSNNYHNFELILSKN